jgi:hypothetical protein
MLKLNTFDIKHMNMEHRLNDKDRVKLKYSKENSAYYHFVHHGFYTDWYRIETSLHGDRTVTLTASARAVGERNNKNTYTVSVGKPNLQRRALPRSIQTILVPLYQTAKRHIPDVKNLKNETGMKCCGLTSLDPEAIELRVP